MSVPDSLEQWREHARKAYEAELEISKMFDELRQLEDRRDAIRRLFENGTQ